MAVDRGAFHVLLIIVSERGADRHRRQLGDPGEREQAGRDKEQGEGASAEC